MLPRSISLFLLLVHAVNAVLTTITTVNPAGQPVTLVTENGVAVAPATTTTPLQQAAAPTTTTPIQQAAAPTTTTPIQQAVVPTTTTPIQQAAAPTTTTTPLQQAAAPTTTTTPLQQAAAPATTTPIQQAAAPTTTTTPLQQAAAPTTTTTPLQQAAAPTTTTPLQQVVAPGGNAPIQNAHGGTSVSSLSVDLSYAPLLSDRPNPSTAVRSPQVGTYASDPYATIEEKGTTYTTTRKETDAWITSTISGGTETTHIKTNYQQFFSIHNTIAESVQAGSVGLGTISGSVGDYRPPFTITTTNGAVGFTYVCGVGSVMSVLLMVMGFVL